MNAYIRILTPSGLQPVDYSATSLAEAAHDEPDGIYTITNTYDTFKILKLDAHLDRMEDSAKRENISLRLDRPRLRNALRQMIADYNQGDVRFRVTVPRQQPDHFILTLEPFRPPTQEQITQGVRLVTAPGLARHNPAAKTTDWMHNRDQFNLPAGIYTGLLLDDQNNILEGFSSNFYAVLEGELRTAGDGVLPGISQQIVFAVAPEIIPIRKIPVNISDLPRIDEAFITSSSRGVIPVVEIDGVTVGNGKPGEKSNAIRAAYLAWMGEHLEEL
jgi:branched-chain amino acid aminotransferase